MLKFQNKRVISTSDWDSFIQKTYNRPYCFQQQENCRERGTYDLIVPYAEPYDYENDEVPEEVNSEDGMGVSFKSWLSRDPKQKLPDPDEQEDYCLKLWWHRNFYPSIEMLVNDLYGKGLLDSGDYTIDIN